MIKRMIINIRNFNISGYSQLIDFLKNNAAGYESKKANVFSPEDIKTFMCTAPDDKYLAMKVKTEFMIGFSTNLLFNSRAFFSRLSWLLG